MSLTIKIEGIGAVYAVDKYKAFRDEIFENLWDFASTPKQKMVEPIITGPVNTTAAARQRENKAMQETIREEQNRSVV